MLAAPSWARGSFFCTSSTILRIGGWRNGGLVGLLDDGLAASQQRTWQPMRPALSARTVPCRRGNQPFMTAALSCLSPSPSPARPAARSIHRNRRKVLLFQPDAAHRRGCFSQDSAVSDFSAACLADPSRNSCPVVSQQRMREFCEIPLGVSRASHGAAVKLWRPANLVRPASDRSPRTVRHPPCRGTG